MEMWKLLGLLALVSGEAAGFLFGGPLWNNLIVKWGLPGVNKHIFQHMPRTTREAQRKGWVPKSNGDFCNQNVLQFRGTQYWNGNDPTIILLFGHNGYIAGIQNGYWNGNDPTIILLFGHNGYIAGIQNGIKKSLYTPASFSQGNSFLSHDDLWLLTVYFTKPYQLNSDGSISDVICKEGRTASDFSKYGTGDRLYFQNGTNPLDEKQLVNIPLAQNDINPNQDNGWGNGKCFQSIGKNYFYKLTKNMDCHHMFPYNVAYNRGKLNVFSFMVNSNINSTFVEHFTPTDAGLVMNNIPDCLYTTPGYEHLSVIHVYLSDCPVPTQICKLC